MKKLAPSGFILVLYAIAYGAVMLSLEGIRPYEQSPFHRYQAEALLRGHLYLADSIYALQPGLAWHNGQVQHVWGLGVGLWLLPFEAVWRLFSHSPCPDRMALGVAFALLAFFSGSTGWKLMRQGQQCLGLGVMWGIVLCPALWTLSRASQLVFEETVLYSVILSLAILVSLVRVVSFGSKSDYFLCCILSAYAMWVRPTHAVYGLGAVMLASLVVWLRRRSAKEVALGVSFWPMSLALLAWTNMVRFGAPAEFGHHLTVSSGCMMYLTRFGNPYHEASLFEALKELFGLLFLTDPRGANAFSSDLFPGQAPYTRWRRLDLTTFDLSYAIFVALIAAGFVMWLVRQKKKGVAWSQPQIALNLSLLLWSGFSMAGLCLFYLYYPAIASRYLMDFAPAFIGFLLLGSSLLRRRWGYFIVFLLGIWLVFEIASAKVPVQPEQPRPGIQLALPTTQGMEIEQFNGLYTPDNNPRKTGIAGNGYGWDAESGIAANVVSLAVDKPYIVELRVSERRAFNGETAKKDVYQAQIDGVSLPLQNIVSNGDELIITFDVPELIRSRQQTEILFLCFSASYEEKDRNSERFLYSVRWR